MQNTKTNEWLEADPARGDLVKQMKAVFDDVQSGRSQNFFVPRIYANYLQYGQLTQKQEAALRRSLDAERPTAVPGVGKIGERVDLNVTLLGVETVNTDFGVRYIHRFRDDDGKIMVWKGASKLPATGRVALRATVKEHHTERDGQAVTFISHAKMASDPAPANDDVRIELRRLADLIEPLARAFA